MTTLNLCLHTGAYQVEYDAVERTHTPPPSGIWHPIPHNFLIEGVRGAMQRAGLEVTQEQHALSHGGQRYFGLMQVRGGSDHCLVVGLRNAHDKRFVAGLVVGSRVFVCDNLAFSGEVVIGRRHTTMIRQDLPRLVHSAMGRVIDMRAHQETRLEAYKGRRLDVAYSDHLLVEMLRAKVIAGSAIPKVLEAYDRPEQGNEAFGRQHTAWRLFNATTEVLKGSNVFDLPRRTQALHGLMDQASGLKLAA